jgi:hypothetical protein
MRHPPPGLRNDCETAQRFGDDAGLELVAAGVTLRMTDLWCLGPDLSARNCRRRPRSELLA